MNCDELQQQTAAQALGALDPAAAAELKKRLADDPAAQAELARFTDVAAALALAASPARSPSAAVRSRILERIRTTPQKNQPIAAPQDRPAPPEGFQFVHDDAGWQASGFPGIQMRLLSVNAKEGYRVLLGKLAPGTRLPHHIHRKGPEELFLISGDLISGGRTLHAGDFMHAEAGTDHDDTWSPSGCVALLIEPVEGPEVVIA